jgi:ribonuclease R
MDFDRIETQVLFDDNGKIANIVATSRNDAHKLIEECMLMANQATAKFLAENNEDFLYRIHPKPTAEKVELTRQFLSAVGLSLEGGVQPESRHFAKVHQTKLVSQYGQSPSHRVWFSQLLKLYIGHTRHLNYP